MNAIVDLITQEKEEVRGARPPQEGEQNSGGGGGGRGGGSGRGHGGGHGRH